MLPRPRKAHVLGLSTLFGLLSCVSPGAAADNEADGRALFEIGVASYKRGQYTAAIAAFREAYRITNRPGLLFSLAQAFRRSYEQTHDPKQLREAVLHYTRYLESSTDGVNRAEASSWLRKLGASQAPRGTARSSTEGARGRLVIAVNVPDAKLILDGRAIPSLPHAADVAPGKHHVEVTAPGYAPFQQEVDVSADATVPMSINLVRSASRIEVLGSPGSEVLIDGVRVGSLPSPGFFVASGRHWVEVRQRGYYTLRQSVDGTAGASHTVDLTASPTTRRTASWVLVGVGAAATLTSGVLGYLALKKQAEAQSLQDQPGMGPAFGRALDARNDLRLAAAASAGLGGAAGAVGLVSILTEGFGPTRTLDRTSAALSVVGVSFSGTF
jgi:tetratricopeptide (TPR) repeat protein